MTEDQIKTLGFKFIKEYPHDEWVTRRYTNGPMHVEFTYKAKKIESVELTIEEINCINVEFDTMQILTPILSSSNNT